MLYAESSAVLAWLFGEPAGRQIGDILGSARTITTSDLTFVECRRVLHRAVFRGEITEADAEGLQLDLSDVSSHWMVSRINQEITARASRRFPIEPLRTLDAIHLATALRSRAAIPGLVLLTLDQHLRENAEAIGFEVIPA